jgi:hypothetical protein
MEMARLYGHAVAMVGDRTDHTYVTSSERHVWPCAGRSEGGRVICTGSGSAWLAHCLAGASSRAGIVYNVTGWCHQMANRILRPAGIDVSSARGYRISYHFWGKYGRDASPDGTWPELHHCSELEAAAGLHEEGSPFLSQSGPQRGPLTSVPTRLNRMIDEHLGHDFASDKRVLLSQLAAESEREQEELVSAFQSERITPEHYLERFTRLAGDLFAGYERILGRDDFVRLFGVAPEHALDFLDPELFRQAHGSRN